MVLFKLQACLCVKIIIPDYKKLIKIPPGSFYVDGVWVRVWKSCGWVSYLASRCWAAGVPHIPPSLTKVSWIPPLMSLVWQNESVSSAEVLTRPQAESWADKFQLNLQTFPSAVFIYSIRIFGGLYVFFMVLTQNRSFVDPSSSIRLKLRSLPSKPLM